MSRLSLVHLQTFNLHQKMSFSLIFSLSLLFTAVTAEGYQLANFDGKIPLPLKLKGTYPPRRMHGQPILVNLSAHILRLSVNTDKQEIEVTLYLRQEWIDHRLAFESPDPWAYREIENPNSIWTPGIFFVNEIPGKSRPGDRETSFFRHYPDGRVLTSQRMTVTACCPMQLRAYPFDTQNCILQMESYGHTVEDLIMQWNTSVDCPVTGDLISPEFLTVMEWKSAVTTSHGTTHSSPKIEFVLNRTPTVIIFRVIVPISMITLFSWTSFLFSRNEIGVRLTLCIAPIIAYLLQMNFSAEFFVAPGYLTGLDIWAGTSFMVMLAALLECIYVTYRKDKRNNNSEEESEMIDRRARFIFAFFVISFDALCLIGICFSRNLKVSLN